MDVSVNVCFPDARLRVPPLSLSVSVPDGHFSFCSPNPVPDLFPSFPDSRRETETVKADPRRSVNDYHDDRGYDKCDTTTQRQDLPRPEPAKFFMSVLCRPPSCASVKTDVRVPRCRGTPPTPMPWNPANPEARNAKVRHDDDPSTPTSPTSTTSTTPTPDERLLRYFDYDDYLDYFLSDLKTVIPNPMCDPKP